MPHLERVVKGRCAARCAAHSVRSCEGCAQRCSFQSLAVAFPDVAVNPCSPCVSRENRQNGESKQENLVSVARECRAIGEALLKHDRSRNGPTTIAMRREIVRAGQTWPQHLSRTVQHPRFSGCDSPRSAPLRVPYARIVRSPPAAMITSRRVRLSACSDNKRKSGHSRGAIHGNGNLADGRCVVAGKRRSACPCTQPWRHLPRSVPAA